MFARVCMLGAPITRPRSLANVARRQRFVMQREIGARTLCGNSCVRLGDAYVAHSFMHGTTIAHSDRVVLPLTCNARIRSLATLVSERVLRNTRALFNAIHCSKQRSSPLLTPFHCDYTPWGQNTRSGRVLNGRLSRCSPMEIEIKG